MTDSGIGNAYSLRAVEYAQFLGTVDQMHQADTLLIARWASHLPGDSVLDAGCGPGHWTNFLQQQGLKAEGIDLVPEFIDHARVAFPDVSFRVASFRRIDREDRSLNGLLAWYSLIHCLPEEVPSILNEFRRVLASGGSLLLGFFDGSTGERFPHKVTDAFCWSPEAMASALERAGFEVSEVEMRHDPGQRPHAAIIAVAR